MADHDSGGQTPAPPLPGDPRYNFAHVVGAVGELVEATTPDMVDNATPCTDFRVAELLDHFVFLARSVASIGQGLPWSDTDQAITSNGWLADYRNAAHAIMETWADPALLEALHEAPWGPCPGSVVMHMYTAEFAIHGWDLSQATGLDLSIANDLLEGAQEAIRFVPAEGRDDPEMPFAAVVDPGPDAPLLLQIAGWAGRKVND